MVVPHRKMVLSCSSLSCAPDNPHCSSSNICEWSPTHMIFYRCCQMWRTNACTMIQSRSMLEWWCAMPQDCWSFPSMSVREWNTPSGILNIFYIKNAWSKAFLSHPNSSFWWSFPTKKIGQPQENSILRIWWSPSWSPFGHSWNCNPISWAWWKQLHWKQWRNRSEKTGGGFTNADRALKSIEGGNMLAYIHI